MEEESGIEKEIKRERNGGERRRNEREKKYSGIE